MANSKPTAHLQLVTATPERKQWPRFIAALYDRIEARSGFEHFIDRPGRVRWLIAAALNCGQYVDEIMANRQGVDTVQEQLFSGPLPQSESAQVIDIFSRKAG